MIVCLQSIIQIIVALYLVNHDITSKATIDLINSCPAFILCHRNARRGDLVTWHSQRKIINLLTVSLLAVSLSIVILLIVFMQTNVMAYHLCVNSLSVNYSGVNSLCVNSEIWSSNSRYCVILCDIVSKVKVTKVTKVSDKFFFSLSSAA